MMFLDVVSIIKKSPSLIIEKVLIHFSQVLRSIKKPVTYFAEQDKWLVSI